MIIRAFVFILYLYVHAEEGWGSLELELQGFVSHPTWVLRTEVGPLEEQQLFLTTKPFLQFLKEFLPFAFLPSLSFFVCVCDLNENNYLTVLILIQG